MTPLSAAVALGAVAFACATSLPAYAAPTTPSATAPTTTPLQAKAGAYYFDGWTKGSSISLNGLSRSFPTASRSGAGTTTPLRS